MANCYAGRVTYLQNSVFFVRSPESNSLYSPDYYTLKVWLKLEEWLFENLNIRNFAKVR